MEELLEGSVYPGERLRDPLIEREVAHAYARFHSLNLPLPDMTDQLFTNQFKPISEDIRQVFEENRIDLSFMSLDGDTYLPWIRAEMEKIRSRIVLCQFDTNQQNVFIRDNPREGEHKVVLLDYEMAKKTFRGIDIGGHFINRTVKWDVFDKEKTTGYPYPSIEERKRFINFYLEETERLGYLSDFDRNGRDSVENVLVEARLGTLLYIVLLQGFISQRIKSVIDNDFMFFRCLPHFVSIFEMLMDEHNKC